MDGHKDTGWRMKSLMHKGRGLVWKREREKDKKEEEREKGEKETLGIL